MSEKNIEQQVRGELGGNAAYVAERTGWIKAQREMTELKLAQARAELAPTGPLALAMGAVASGVKQSVLAVPSAVAQMCVGKPQEEIHRLIQKALRNALEPFNEDRIARIIESACRDAGETHSAGLEAPAGTNGKRMGGQGKKAKSGGKRKPGGVENE